MFGFRIDSADGVDLRPALLRTLTELYVQKPTHSLQEERHFTELALRLIDVVDAAEQQAAAERLLAYGRAPNAVLLRLAERLAGMQAAADRAKRPDADEAAFLPDTVPAGPEELNEIFFSAGPAERRLILEALDYASIAPAPAPRSFYIHDAVQRLGAAALARATDQFARILADALGIAEVLAMRIATDPHGEPVTCAARALAMPADVVQRILLFLDPAIGENPARVCELMRLHEEMPQDSARRLLSIWRRASSARTLRHQPFHYDDEAPHARAASSPARRVARPFERGRRNTG
jgi:hypothetical protein